ncbi:MAG: LysR family transcriptional regulator [Ruminococcaceae bacterium]|nr:LysR family transcriptional regulator [Oscillospiraceae bacterium]
MIRYTAFCKIVEYGSFTKAAEALGYTQAAVSQMIRSLESEYKLTLMTRTRTGVHLTPEGEILYPYIQKTVASARALQDKAREIIAMDAGEIRIGAVSSVSQHLLPQMIQKFGQTYPHICFRLYESDYTTMGDWLRSGYVDFCFADLTAMHGFHTILLAKDYFMAVLPEDHPLTHNSVVPLSALGSEPMIAAEEGNVSTVLSSLSSIGIKPNVQYIAHDDNTILALVEQGLGFSILPAMVLDKTNYRFKALPTSPVIERHIGIVYQEMEQMPLASQQFLHYLTESPKDYITGHYRYVSE